MLKDLAARLSSRKFMAFVATFVYSLQYRHVFLAAGSGIGYMAAEALVDAAKTFTNKTSVTMNTTTTVDRTEPKAP